ncbi:MAG: prolipoprotein diacylglyceryl transferase [Bacillota bacterium]|jgi:phosphatidylglycerol:prolipoprotein diacylglycerol transferase
MKPIIGRIFGLDIHGYGTAIALGFLTAVIIGIILGRKKGFQFETIIDVAIFGCIGGLVGAKLGYAILNLRFYLAYPLAFLDFREGYSIVGGLLGGTLAGILYLRKKKLPVWKMADVAAYCIPPAYAIGRVGCLLEGCCYGVESDVPWALACGPGSALRHPTQIYSSIGALIILLILFLQRKHKRFSGFFFAQFIFLYSIERFIVELFREGDAILLGLSYAQIFTIFSGLAALAVMIVGERRRLNRLKGETVSDGEPGDEELHS